MTDAISSLYDYGDQQNHRHPNQRRQSRQDSRPLSFLPSSREEIHRSPSNSNYQNDTSRSFAARATLNRALSDETPTAHNSNGQDYMVGRSNSAGHPNGQASPPANGLRSPAETASASFPLNDIDYESSPAAVAQELSNLQAIRRMSMDVNLAGDPDLPTFNSMPTMAPTGSEDEDDASRLFWVPARLHPELAPKEFKTFLDNRVESIKRRSGEYTVPTSGPSRSGSGGGLRRKKSMLSRQIDNSEGKGAEGYQDGADRLDRKRSQSGQEPGNTGIANLQELEALVNDPSKTIQRLSLDAGQRYSDGELSSGDMPILPAAPGGNSLRRSTRTQYRRERLGPAKPSKRAVKVPEVTESEAEDLPGSSPVSPTGHAEPPIPGVSRVRTEPPPNLGKVQERPPLENFSRPARLNRNRAASPPLPTGPSPPVSFDSILSTPTSGRQEAAERQSYPPIGQTSPPSSREPKPFVSQIASNGRTTAQLGMVPSIVETPPPAGEPRSTSQQSYRQERKSTDSTSIYPPPGPSALRGAKRTQIGRLTQQANQPNQTLQHMAAHPSPLPGNSTRTDSLSFIPTLTEDKKAEGKKDGTKKSSWSWGALLGSEEKEKERRKEEEAKEASKKSRAKLGKPNDNTRLDVLQTTMEGQKGRESLVLDRGDLKLEEERKKESTRKSSDSRKEKDSGLFSSLFGGGKKKPDRETGGKKSLRPLSPEPPRPSPKPDIDYNWTRFSILEERAIYRMAHIKLANPRRALYSQVLLSNFMYSYLAKVQQMHPQIQIPQNAAQKAQQRAQQQQQQQQQSKKNDQPEEFYQYQRYQEVSLYTRPCSLNH